MNFGVTQTGEGRPLVLLHGVGVDHTIWTPSFRFGEAVPCSRRGLARFRRVGIEEPYDLLGQSRAIIESSRSARRVYAGTAVAAETNLAPLLQALSTPLGLIWGERDNTVKLAVAHEIQRIRPGDSARGGCRERAHPARRGPGEFAAALDRRLARLAEPG